MMTVLIREQESYKQALLNSDTLHLISTGIQNNIAQLIEDLETASKNTRPPILLVPKPMYQNSGERRKTKGKQEKGVLWLWKIETGEQSLCYFSFTGRLTPVDAEYDYINQVENVNLATVTSYKADVSSVSPSSVTLLPPPNNKIIS